MLSRRRLAYRNVFPILFLYLICLSSFSGVSCLAHSRDASTAEATLALSWHYKRRFCVCIDLFLWQQCLLYLFILSSCSEVREECRGIAKPREPRNPVFKRTWPLSLFRQFESASFIPFDRHRCDRKRSVRSESYVSRRWLEYSRYPHRRHDFQVRHQPNGQIKESSITATSSNRMAAARLFLVCFRLFAGGS